MAMTFPAIAARLRGDSALARTSAVALDAALGRVESALAASNDVYDQRLGFSAAIATTDDSALRSALVRLRAEFDASFTEGLIAEVATACATSPEAGWTCWVRLFGDAFVRFRHPQAAALCDHPFAFDASHDATRAEFRRAVNCMAQSRWEEVDDTFAILSKHPSLSTRTHARLVALQAQVELWRFFEKARAATLMEEAERIAPRDPFVLATAGDLASEQGNRDLAIQYFDRSIAASPTDANGYINMGDRFEKDGLSDDAEKWWRRATVEAPGEVSGHDRLLRRLVRLDALRKDRAAVDALLALRNQLDPEGEYDAYILIGDVCRTYMKEQELSGDDKRWYVTEARAWFDRARSLVPSSPLTYCSLAELSRDEGDLVQAEQWALAAITLAPECPSGYLFLGPFYMDQSRWTDAARIFKTFPARPDRWKLYASATLGRIQFEQEGEHDKGLATLLDVLRVEALTDREQVFAESILETLADDAAKKRNDREAASRIYDDILSAKGAAYQGRHDYLIGNLFNDAQNYGEAEAHYRRAVAARPDEATYHRALGEALKAQGRFDEAIAAIDRAFEIDKDDKRRREFAASVANAQGNAAFAREQYVEAAASYRRASELEPTLAVYWSNMAMALERVKAPGSRVADLEQAQRAYTRAQQLANDQKYAVQIEGLRRRASLATSYGEQALEWVAVVTPIVVDVADDLVPLVADESRTALSPALEREVEAMRAAFAEEFGITLPGIRFRSQPDLATGTFIVQINEVPILSSHVDVAKRFFPGSVAELGAMGTLGDPAADPVTGQPGVWVAEAEWARLDSVDLRLWTVTRYVLRDVERVVRRRAVDFVGHEEVMALLRQTEGDEAAQVLAAPTAISALTNVCRALASESISLKAFAEIVRTFKSLYDSGLRPHDIVERVRLVPAVRDTLPGRDRRNYIRTTERFEAGIRAAMVRRNEHVTLALPLARCQAVLAALRDAVESHERAATAIVVADPALRSFVRRLTELDLPELPVLSVSEARDDVSPSTTRIDLELPTETAPTEYRSRATAVIEDADTNSGTSSESTPSIDITVPAGMSERVTAADGQPLTALLQLMRDGLFFELGLLVPNVFILEGPELPDGAFELRIGDREAERMPGLKVDEAFVNDRMDRLRLLGLEGHDAVNPANGNAGAIVTLGEQGLQACRQAGVAVWGPAGYLVLRLSGELRRRASTLHTVEATRHLLDSISAAFPSLVTMALDRFGIGTVSAVFRHLLAEEISVRNVRAILDALLCLDGSSDVDMDRFITFGSAAEPLCFDPLGRAPAALPSSVLAEHVRTCLRAYLSHKYARGTGSMPVYLLHADVENWLRQLRAPVGDADRSRLASAVRDEVSTLPSDVRTILLTNVDVRAKAAAMLRVAVPNLVVLSFQELSQDLNISPIGRIGWSSQAPQPSSPAAETM